ncbi:hypothetical protein Sjap_009476 [Stephania japonica]|uniref:Uncharacterized protein n=1 Tax=Stephania japonica TaxID=461633 RepID=A0AAP0JRI7_9MAGN
MANPMCLNNTKSDTDRYSPPVPVIGLYIAGTTVISTKVIFSFVVEHILILCFMLLLLMIFWFCSIVEMNRVKDIPVERNKQIFKTGEQSLMHRVKHWYVYSCMYNPQLLISRGPSGFAVVICIFCTVILSQAAFRSLVLNKMKFCEDFSDYKYRPMQMIVMTQIVFILIGSLIIVFRWFTLAALHFNHINPLILLNSEVENFLLQFMVMKMRSIKISIMIFYQLFLKYGLAIIFVSFCFFPALAPFLLCCPLLSLVVVVSVMKKIFSKDDQESLERWKNEFQCVDLSKDRKIPKDKQLLEWILELSLNGMDKWRNASESSNMVQILSRPSPSAPISLLNKIKDIGASHNSHGYKITCLSMVLLVKIVVVSIPSHLSKSLRLALVEAFEIIYFIDEKVNVGSFEDQRKRELARLLRAGGDIRLGNISLVQQGVAPVEVALSKFDAACRDSPEKLTKIEMKIMKDFVEEQSNYASVEDLCNRMERLFAEMLLWFLKQLPSSILEEIQDSPIEEYEERAKIVLKLLYKLDPSLEDKVQWAFPPDVHAQIFFDPHDQGIQSDTTVLIQDVDATTDTGFIPSDNDVEIGSS